VEGGKGEGRCVCKGIILQTNRSPPNKTDIYAYHIIEIIHFERIVLRLLIRKEEKKEEKKMHMHGQDGTNHPVHRASIAEEF